MALTVKNVTMGLPELSIKSTTVNEELTRLITMVKTFLESLIYGIFLGKIIQSLGLIPFSQIFRPTQLRTKIDEQA